jgi:hypothetical protein
MELLTNVCVWVHLYKVQTNKPWTFSLENLVPHIDVPAEFNQGMSKSAHEHRNRL